MKAIICLLVILLAMQGKATELAEAFTTLTDNRQTSAYQAQGRGYMVGGDAIAHLPSDKIQLVNLSPPHYSAGCNGVDFYYGGYSYISGQQFIQLLKNISSNALGYSFQLSLRTLCPVCATIIADLQKAVQAANKLAIDQCQLAENLVSKNIQNEGLLGRFFSHQAAKTAAASGEASDYLAALGQFTTQASTALERLTNNIANIAEASQQTLALQQLGLGSHTWNLLGGLAQGQKVFIQSLVGSTVVSNLTQATYNKNQPFIFYLAPTLTASSLQKIFMFGVKAKENAEVYLWECSANNSPFTAGNFCLNPNKILLKDSAWYHANKSVSGIAIADIGLFGMTYLLLGQALINIKLNHALGTAEQVTLPENIYGDQANKQIAANFSAQQIISFISNAYLPVYRALKIAASQTETGESLLHDLTTLISSHYTLAYLRNFLDLKHLDNTPNGTLAVPPTEYNDLSEKITSVLAAVANEVAETVKSINTNSAWSKHILNAESIIYEQNLTAELQGNLINFFGKLQ